jgi:hypothetical protein
MNSPLPLPQDPHITRPHSEQASPHRTASQEHGTASKLGGAHAAYETCGRRQGVRRHTGCRGVERAGCGTVTRARVTCFGMAGAVAVSAGARGKEGAREV